MPEARFKHGVKKLTKEQIGTVDVLDHMIKQLKNAASIGNPPFLVTSEVIYSMSHSRRATLERILGKNMPRGTKILLLPETDLDVYSQIILQLVGKE